MKQGHIIQQQPKLKQIFNREEKILHLLSPRDNSFHLAAITKSAKLLKAN